MGKKPLYDPSFYQDPVVYFDAEFATIRDSGFTDESGWYFWHETDGQRTYVWGPFRTEQDARDAHFDRQAYLNGGAS